MTDLLYQTDAQLSSFTAQVIALEDDGLVLDRTAFYPGGGGQPSDRGFIEWQRHVYALSGIRKAADHVFHRLQADEAHPLPPVGAVVKGVLNWDHRLKCMRTHTALHILCGVIWRDYGALVTGGNMEPLSARMDFELEHMSADFATEVEARINAEVAAARPVRVRVLPRAEAFLIPDLIRTKINLLPPEIAQVRIVEIVGLDIQADGGTHVPNTQQVGYIHVVRHESKGKINKRLRIALDE
jgi:misacylated tRNA(Ala) deacylase